MAVVQIDPVSQLIPSNVGFNIYIKRISLSVKMQYYISLHSTFRRPKLQEHYEIQNQSKFVMVQLRLEEFSVVMDQTLYAKLDRLYRSTHTANVIGTFHITVNYSPQMGNGSKMLTCATYALYQESLQRVQYPAYHMEECTIDQYNLGEMEGILPEAGG